MGVCWGLRAVRVICVCIKVHPDVVLCACPSPHLVQSWNADYYTLHAALFLQLDKASADANEYKAGYDKVMADSVEQKAQVSSVHAFLSHLSQRP